LKSDETGKWISHGWQEDLLDFVIVAESAESVFAAARFNHSHTAAFRFIISRF